MFLLLFTDLVDDGGALGLAEVARSPNDLGFIVVNGVDSGAMERPAASGMGMRVARFE